MIRRIFVEQKENFRNKANSCLKDLKLSLGLANLESLRILQRYDIEKLSDEDYQKAKHTIFSEVVIEDIYEESFPLASDEEHFAIEFLAGQFDQRADSAEQCVQLVAKNRPKIACANVYVLKGNLSEADIKAVQKYLVNEVDSRISPVEKPETLIKNLPEPKMVETLETFMAMSKEDIANLHKKLSLAMTVGDLEFCQNYFKNEEKRNPTITEIKLLDTYWSDHCRHTTFLTRLDSVDFESGAVSDKIKEDWNNYLSYRSDLGLDKRNKAVCLMDIALIATRKLKSLGKLKDLEESEEINAASIVVDVDVDGEMQEWLVMFKNETHNHPTEIEPFGGAATCLGGAIRDPLSGRSYVYQAMRVTGAADPRKAYCETLEGKLAQSKICRSAADGYSSYGNQIGLATGQVSEIYHDSYVAKRLEVGAVVAAAPRDQVIRGTPECGDVILLVGGATGRDGIGGATGSSKDHDDNALENSAEVQKGDAPMERKLQRLFRNPKASKLIKRCNDFGAGGVSVAIGELAPSLEINLDEVSKKYDGLDGTELAISESQERMAVVVDIKDAKEYKAYAQEENLECKQVAVVTDTGRLVMKWKGVDIVNLSREFLDTNGVESSSTALVTEPTGENPMKPKTEENTVEAWFETLQKLNVCSQRGLVETFDSSVGASAVLHPFGGKYLSSPTDCMCSKIALPSGDTNTSTIFSWGFNPELAMFSPYYGAIYAIVESVAKIVSAGGDYSKVYLTLQEYFEKLRQDPKRWAKPLSALLGALKVQMELSIAAIGGKDSMSGSFKDLDVVPTLISFAIATEKATNVISPEFKNAGSAVCLVKIDRDELLLPNFADLKKKYTLIKEGILAKKIIAARPLRSGGLAEAISKSCFGNALGFSFDESFVASHFDLDFGSIILELADGVCPSEFEGIYLGKTTPEAKIKFEDKELDLAQLCSKWESVLENVYPTLATPAPSDAKKYEYTQKSSIYIAKNKVAKPKVFIPVFPGTNCEYDTLRAFEKAGATSDIFVFKNRSRADINDSVAEMAKRIEQSQIVMFAGGFSAGDEPAGSGKFIASVFRNKLLSDAINSHVKDKQNLVLGICNGFQALIKLGLVPYGQVVDIKEDSPTLTYNNISRHISCYAKTRVASSLSPWYSESNVGDTHSVALSHGEGKFVASPQTLELLAKNGQIASQYVDDSGEVATAIPHNPNGSVAGIEGITSPCGLVLGKMGHSERFGSEVGINIYGNKVEPIFISGVKYFV